MAILVTGGAGFIGSNFVIDWLDNLDSSSELVVNLDKLTYAGNVHNLFPLRGRQNHSFQQGDIADTNLVAQLLAHHRPRAVVNLAAESHVDRSINGPEAFVTTNVMGTFQLLEATKYYWLGLTSAEQQEFRFLHISTDEVYGSLMPRDPAFKEDNRYQPNSPYSASKAASDHLVRAYHHTYGLPVLTANCSNNYGPYQFPEKLIPLTLHNALTSQPLPIYGDGQQRRDWLYVKDHCSALRCILRDGKPGESYNIGGYNEKSNLAVVQLLCRLLDKQRPRRDGKSYIEQINLVKDRPGHDRRYSIDATKIAQQLGWKPLETFASGIQKTVKWYLDNEDWLQQVTSGAYRNWIAEQYAV